MSQIERRQSFSIAGKTFLLGEYAALAGLPVLVAAHGPRFSLDVAGDLGSDARGFPSQSPLGRLLTWARARGIQTPSFSFRDPYEGAGGFGASTAQFALGYLALASMQAQGGAPQWDCRWQAVWGLYRELHASEPVPPSGADLVAQWQGGIIALDARSRHCRDLWPVMDWSGLLVFSATRARPKVPTHKHLRELREFEDRQLLDPASVLMKELDSGIAGAVSALGDGNVAAFGGALTAYAEILSRHGLEAPGAREDRLALGALPEVAGAKGAGALLSDSVVVLMKPGNSAPESAARMTVIREAERRGLKLVVDGFACEMGTRACRP